MRAVVVHGHYYQPPREDPWLEVVAAEANAAPYHDWNVRIERECYRAVVAARLPAADGRIARILNALSWTSFDFGPTLLDWLEREAPDTYAQVLAADRDSRERVGFGNAVASPYHHVILPLGSRRDVVTEVRWGSADFRRRFGRVPEGMWLPETAVDDATLDVLAEHGIAFTIVAPHQVAQPPARGLPGLYRTGNGREIALFVYDGPLSHDVAFGAALKDGAQWARRMLEGAGAGPAVVSVATDGETFGHHHRFAEMALARMVEDVRRSAAATLTNFAAVLAQRRPSERVTLVAPSSWSCVHGVDRWRTDCGCRVAPEKGLHQRWRAPLRGAVEWLAGELHAVFDREAGALLADPWAARDACGELGRHDGAATAAVVAAHARRPLSAAEVVRARELLEMELNALRLFTSCASSSTTSAGWSRCRCCATLLARSSCPGLLPRSRRRSSDSSPPRPATIPPWATPRGSTASAPGPRCRRRCSWPPRTPSRAAPSRAGPRTAPTGTMWRSPATPCASSIGARAAPRPSPCASSAPRRCRSW